MKKPYIELIILKESCKGKSQEIIKLCEILVDKIEENEKLESEIKELKSENQHLKDLLADCDKTIVELRGF